MKKQAKMAWTYEAVVSENRGEDQIVSKLQGKA